MRSDSFIWDVSLGATRELVLYETVTNAKGKKVAGPEKHRLRLEDGDMFILGPESNRLFLHALVKHPLGEAYPERISVIYRDIKTFKKPSSRSAARSSRSWPRPSCGRRASARRRATTRKTARASARPRPTGRASRAPPRSRSVRSRST